jgi:hypothetical protein
MRWIPTRLHGAMDYLEAVVLAAAPWLLGFDDVPAARNTALVVAAIVFLQSLFTDYELGAVRRLPMSAHLGLDVVAGLFLAASPWLFGFADGDPIEWVPHLVVGLGMTAAALMTETTPRDARLTGRPAARAS